MRYDHLHTPVYVPNPKVPGYTELWHAFTFPEHWFDAVREFTELTKGKRYPTIRISGLNDVIRAVAPDLVHVASTSLSRDQPWLYGRNPLPVNIMSRLVLEYLKDLAANYDVSATQLQAVYRNFEVSDTPKAWEPAVVDLWEKEVMRGDTGVPANRLFRLLPDVIAQRITRQEPYEFNGTSVRFVQVNCDKGAEVMAWPPLRHGSEPRPSYFSPMIRIRLHTVPFSPVPRVMLDLGIRRWLRHRPNAKCSGPFWLPEGRGVNVYLRPDHPWLSEAGAAQRMARAKLRWNPRLREVTWANGGPGEMLARLGATGEFPDLETLRHDTHAYLSGSDADLAAVPYSTMMGKHAIGTGFSPSERMRVLEWAGQALEPEFVRQGGFERAAANHLPGFEFGIYPKSFNEVEFPEKPETEDEVALAAYNVAFAEAEKKQSREQRKKAKHVEEAAKEVEAWRELLAKATDCEEVVVQLLYDTAEVRDAIVAAAQKCLGARLDIVTANDATGDFEYYLDAVTTAVRIKASLRGVLGQPLLVDGKTPERGTQHQEAERQRAADAKTYLSGLQVPGELAIIELPGRTDFADEQRRYAGRRDPKQAIRRGAAKAAMVTQFIRPPNTTGDDLDESLSDRAMASWQDGLRSIGVRFIPKVESEDPVFQNVNQVAFWLIKRNRTRDRNFDQYTPVAVLISPDERRVMARVARMSGWAPFPDVLREVALAEPRGDDLRYAKQQEEEYARFLRTTLKMLNDKPTVAFVAANNSRHRWTWIQDRNVEADLLQLNATSPQDLAKSWSNLRIVRVRRRGGDCETPQWWAPANGDDTPEAARSAGLSTGFWRLNSDPDRVFYSLAEKNPRMSVGTRTSKLTGWTTKDGATRGPQPQQTLPMPDLVEVVPIGLQPGDDPTDWALFAHQQRFVSEYRTGLGWPLPLKLAEDIAEYANPADDPDLVDDAEQDQAPAKPDDAEATAE